MNSLFARTCALLAHAILNFILVTWLTNYDISGSWLGIAGFIILLALLLMLFLRHIISFIYFLKTKTK